MSDVTIVTSDNPRTEKPEKIIHDILKGVVKTGTVIVKTERKAAIQCALKIANQGDLVLVAGKGHETYQLVAGRKKTLRRQRGHSQLFRCASRRSSIMTGFTVRDFMNIPAPLRNIWKASLMHRSAMFERIPVS